MNVASNIPAPAIPVLGPDGRMTTVWFQFFMTLYTRTGGAQGIASSDLSIGISEDSGVEDVKQQLGNLRDLAGLLPAAVPALAGDDQAPPAAVMALPDDLSRPEAQAPPQEAPSGRIEALEALVQRLAADIEAIRQGQQL